jgi:hypothetical protein
MSQPLRVLSFPPRPTMPHYLNASALPLSAQPVLCDVMARFDRMMLERPAAAAEVLRLADQIMKIYGG